MDRSARILITTIFAVYLVALAAFVVYSIREFSADEVLLVFRRRWVISNALYLFIEHLISVQLTAVILAFSLLIRSARSRAGARFFDLVRPVLVVVLVMTFLYTLAMGLAAPRLAYARADVSYRSDLADSFLNRANEALEKGDWARAITEYEACLAIDPDNTNVEASLATARQRYEETQQQEAAPAPEPPAGHEITSQDPDQLVDRATEALAEEDFISAHYWAQLALEIDPGRPEAEDILREANRRMASLELSNVDEQERAVYERKRDAYEAWTNGDVFRAYRIFSDLAEEHPRDSDVQRYLPKVEEDLRSVAYFADPRQPTPSFMRPT